MVVADVSSPIILGFDFLRSFKGVLDVVEGTLLLQGKKFPCVLESNLPVLCSVVVAETVQIPPMTEMIIPGEVDCPGLGSTPLCVEMSEHYLNLDSEILLARCVVDPSQHHVPLRVANLSLETKVLRKNSALAVGEVLAISHSTAVAPDSQECSDLDDSESSPTSAGPTSTRTSVLCGEGHLEERVDPKVDDDSLGLVSPSSAGPHRMRQAGLEPGVDPPLGAGGTDTGAEAMVSSSEKDEVPAHIQ
ncbi:unnamed protein product, partial [Owenia fusiformis]